MIYDWLINALIISFNLENQKVTFEDVIKDQLLRLICRLLEKTRTCVMGTRPSIIINFCFIRDRDVWKLAICGERFSWKYQLYELNTFCGICFIGWPEFMRNFFVVFRIWLMVIFLQAEYWLMLRWSRRLSDVKWYDTMRNFML